MGKCSEPIVIPRGYLDHPLLEGLFCFTGDQPRAVCRYLVPESVPEVAITYDELAAKMGPSFTCDQYREVSGQVTGLLELLQITPDARSVMSWDGAGKMWQRVVAGQKLILRRAGEAAAKKGYQLTFRPHNQDYFNAYLKTPRAASPELVGTFTRNDAGMLALLDVLQTKIRGFPAQKIEQEHSRAVRRKVPGIGEAATIGQIATSGAPSSGMIDTGHVRERAVFDRDVPAPNLADEMLSTSSAYNTLRRYHGRFRMCYEGFLKKYSRDFPTWKIAFQFEIDRQGKATDLRVVRNNLGKGYHLDCMTEAVKDIAFPKPTRPSQQGPYETPFIFTPEG